MGRHYELSGVGGAFPHRNFRQSSQDGGYRHVNIVEEAKAFSLYEDTSSKRLHRRFSMCQREVSNHHEDYPPSQVSDPTPDYEESGSDWSGVRDGYFAASTDIECQGQQAESDILFDVSSGFDRYTAYEPIIVDQHLKCETTRRFDHYVNSLGSQFNIPGWAHELEFENDNNLREYLWYGVSNGFLIVDVDSDIPSYECQNYASVTSGKAFDYVDNWIHEGLKHGKFIVSQEKPWCVHGIGAVPKKGTDKWRPITDCKRPIGESVNNFMLTTFRDFCYSTVDQVVDMVSPNCYMASIDIEAAYRSVLVHPAQWTYQGLSWNINGVKTYLCDTHLCFGLRCAPYLFTQISNFVIRCLKRRGFNRCLVYLDDFIVMGDTWVECNHAHQTLIQILRSLGFFISWSKCVSPTQILTYLGVVFNSTDMSVSLPPDKLSKLKQELDFFIPKKRATIKQIQRLCGILAHCAKVIKGGRTFSHRVISLLKGLPDNKKRIRLSEQFKFDLFWWRDFAAYFNGKNLMIKYNHGVGPAFYTDACLRGYGLYSEGDWQAGYFNAFSGPDTSKLDVGHGHWVNVHIQDQPSATNINVLELIPVWLCIRRWSHNWRNLHVVCYTDNTSVLAMLNKGCGSKDQCMVLLRDIFWYCANYNMHLTARHISGIENVIADRLSRIAFTDDMSVINQFSLCCSDYTWDPGGHGRNR